MQRIRNIGVGLRLAIAFGLLAALLVAVIGVALGNSSQEDRARAEIVNGTPLGRHVLAAKFHAADFNGSQVSYALEAVSGLPGATDDSSGSRRQYLLDSARFRASLETIKADPLTPAERAEVRTLDAGYEKFAALDATIISLYRDGTPESARIATGLLLKDGVEAFDSMATSADRLTALSVKALSNDEAAADRAASRAHTLTLVGGGLALLLAAALSIVITRSITRPLGQAVDVLREVADGDLTRRTDADAKDEVGQMGRP